MAGRTLAGVANTGGADGLCLGRQHSSAMRHMAVCGGAARHGPAPLRHAGARKARMSSTLQALTTCFGSNHARRAVASP